jgi:TPR repeat protein
MKFRSFRLLAALGLLLCVAGVWAQSTDALRVQKEASLVASIKEKAVGGNAAAQENLGWLYEQGSGVRQDYVQAAFWYRKAAEQGDADAQNNLANLYANGQGFVQDYVQAAAWYRKAAEQGSVSAQTQLGQLYDYGQGVPQNYAEAAIWYRKAAEQGDFGAQYRLGGLYANGHGVTKNNVEAYFWLDVAAALAKGKELPAAAERDIVAAKLSPTELSEAQERAAKWFAEHPAPPCIQVSDETRTCFKTQQDMEDEIHSHKENQ